MNRRYQSIIAMTGLWVLIFSGVTLAVNPPLVTDFSFDPTTQRIEFTANSGGKTCNFAIASSSPSTTFDPAAQGGSFGGVSGGTDWGITPGAAPLGQIHTFTITVSNSNGVRSRCMELKVVASNIAGGNEYQFQSDCLDYFFTPGNVCNPPVSGSYLQFGAGGGGPPALPADFFGPGSQPFTGTICWQGAPLGSGFGQADTVVRRTLGLNFDCPCGPSCDGSVPIEIVALRLVSIDPIVVNFGGGSSLYTVMATLSEVQPQVPGLLSATRDCIEGGMFTSNLPVIARLTFVKASGAFGNQTVVMDPALPAPNFQVGPGTGFWSQTPEFNAVPGGSFYAGINWLPCDCNAGTAETAVKVLTLEQAVWAAHGVQVENTNKEHIPTVSEWGVATMTLLMVIAATIILKRRVALS